MDHRDPYLSVIVTSRNDNHGGTLLRRMQTFTNSFIAQCRRHGLSAELLIVEWNPPVDRPPLAKALRWPADTSPCQVRIIEVPPELHHRIQHADTLPLFQMIAKNVGIRRARGRFLLATNIDILFSDELIEFLAREELQAGVMYRIDRLDVSTDVPVDASVPVQLEYCTTHYLRNNARLGVIRLTPDGRPDYGPIVAADGVLLTEGWGGLESTSPESFGWATPGATIELRAPVNHPPILGLEIDPGPSLHSNPFTLRVTDAGGRLVAHGRVAGRQQVCLQLPLTPGETHVFHLASEETPAPLEIESRLLLFRLLRCTWEDRMPPASPEQQAASQNFAIREIGLLAPKDLIPPEVGVRFGRGWYGVDQSDGPAHRWASTDPILVVDSQEGAGQVLELELEPGPGVERQPFDLQVFDATGRLAAQSRVTTRECVCLDLPLDPAGTHWFRLHAVGGGRPLPDGAVLDFRLFAVERRTQAEKRRAPFRPQLAAARWRGRFDRLLWTPLVAAARSCVRNMLQRGEAAKLVAAEATFPTKEGRPSCPVLLHLTACGDFTMLAREHWFDLHGYPEWHMFSLHIDSVFCFMAHHSGAVEQVLEPPMRIFHIEHSLGSGATPEGINLLEKRMQAQGIPCLDPEQMLKWGSEMRTAGRPIIFNDENWGLAAETLKETVIPCRSGLAA